MPRSILSMEQQWQQVLSRDVRADGHFVYAVRSTRIYCRPTCPSRRPRRTNVDFFAQPAEAERAGFRACKRCRPNAAHPQQNIVAEACKFIESHLDARVTLPQLSKHLGYSPFYLQRLFKKTLGITPQQYQSTRRVADLRSGLRGTTTVADAAYGAGYSSSSRLYENAAPRLGMTPASYGKKGRGASITYSIFDSRLGKMLIAATQHGVCSLKFGDSAAELRNGLRQEFAAAQIRRDNAALTKYVAAVRRCIAGQTPTHLPLDIQATAFQGKVWAALRCIPCGSVHHYEDVARSIGRPRSHRAVARACASNNVALLIPCHRVVPKAGGDGGYRWGRERKAALLKAEASR